MNTLVLVGGGGHAAVVAEAATALGFSIAGYLDQRRADPPPLPEMAHLGAVHDLAAVAAKFDSCVIHAAVGDNDLRRSWLDEAGDVSIVAVVHPWACVSMTAHVEAGAFIGPGAIVNARAFIGRGAIINSGAIIEHDCVIGPYAHVAPGAVLAGSVSVAESALIGAAAIVLPGVAIGERCVLGAGSVVREDVPRGMTCVGIPARILQST